MIQFVVKVHKFLFVYSNLVSTNREREKQNMISKNIIYYTGPGPVLYLVVDVNLANKTQQF